MTKQLTVTVTQKDIDDSRAYEGEECPIERALGRRGYDASVGSTTAWLMGTPRYLCRLPKEVSQFIREFDHGKAVEPREFSLEFEEV